MTKESDIYEKVACKVLTDMRETLGLAAVEGRQTLAGLSGTDWTIDAKAWLEGTTGFLVVEARRYTTSRLSQEHVAAVAYRIADIGGAGGIIVSPEPLQKGAKLVAAHENIAHVQITPESTTETYLAEFIGKKFYGVTVNESVHASDSMDAVVTKGPANN